MKVDGNQIQLEITEQVVGLAEAKSLLFRLNAAIDEIEVRQAAERRRKGILLYSKKADNDRRRLFDETRLLFPRLFNKYRFFGYHPRDIFMVIMDVLTAESDCQRTMYRHDQRQEAEDEDPPV